MAEVAASPSQTSAAVASSAVAAGGRAAFDSSPVARAAFPQALDQHANTHGLPSHAHAHHHTHGHRPHVQYTAAASPSDADAAFFSHNPRLSPGAPVHLEPAERAIPRGLPPLVSSMTGAPSPSASYGDSRAPVSPSAVSLSLSDPSQGLDGQGDSAPRKRSKVSRACDECRRKKIRCDATSESGIEQCSSCKRVGSKCSFSRVPMKRGPSKGSSPPSYIKELADRLNTLENSIQGDLHPYGVAGEGEHSPGPSDSMSPPPTSISSVQKQSRKRTLSSSSDFQSGVHLQPLSGPLVRTSERLPSIDSFHPSNQHQHQQRSQHLETQRQLPQPGLAHGSSHAPPPVALQHPSTTDIPSSYKISLSPQEGQYIRSYPEGGIRKASVSFPFETSEARPVLDNSSFDWDEDAIDQYYTLIHPTFPLLPHSKERLRHRLAGSPQMIRDALLEALYAVVQSNPSSSLQTRGSSPNPRRACELAMASQFDDQFPRASMNTSVLYLQTLILMALEADNHGPATMRGQLGPPRATWLGSAVGLAYNLKLHHGQSRGKYANGDHDADEKLGRRAWWVLVTLDRWHAISTASPLFIPDSSVVLLAEDRELLGEGPYHIARLSCILGHLAEAFTAADETLSAASVNPYISKLLRGELERFRESVEVVWGSLNLLHLAYYHVKLLTLRHNPATEPRQLLEPAARMAAMLDHSLTPITPLNHHFGALALLTLVDLTEIQETRDGAWRGIQQLTEALETRRGLSTRDDSIGWDRAIKDLIIKRTQIRLGTATSATPSELPPGHGNLQHLAELAIGDRSPSSGTGRLTGLDTDKLQRYGYLGSILL